MKANIESLLTTELQINIINELFNELVVSVQNINTQTVYKLDITYVMNKTSLVNVIHDEQRNNNGNDLDWTKNLTNDE